MCCPPDCARWFPPQRAFQLSPSSRTTSLAPSGLRKDQPARSCRARYGRGFSLFFISTALFIFQTLDPLVRELPYVELRLVEVGDVRRVQSIERLLKREDCLEGVALA